MTLGNMYQGPQGPPGPPGYGGSQDHQALLEEVAHWAHQVH